jgi:hypothetical protein
MKNMKNMYAPADWGRNTLKGCMDFHLETCCFHEEKTGFVGYKP